jgi:hypothetical protein
LLKQKIKKMNTKLLLSLSVAWCATGLVALAAPIAPTGSPLVTLNAAGWGGTGIANTAVAETTDNLGNGNAITLGLTATPRYPNPPVGEPLNNNGSGTFYATPGSADATHLGYGTWNFDFYVNLVGGGNFNNYVFTLIYGNNAVGFTSTVLNTLYSATSSTTTIQDSYNLGFLTIPGGFDPNANGQYGIELEVTSPTGGAPILTDAINVNVGTVPDATSTAGLLGLGLGSLSLVGFAKNRLQKA